MGFHRPGWTSGRAWGPRGIGDTAEPGGQLPVRRGLERSVPVRPGHHAVPAGAFLRNGRVHLARRAAAIIEAHGIDTLVASPAYGAELLAGAETGTRCRCGTSSSSASRWEPSGSAWCARPHPDVAVRSLAYSTSETGPLGYQCRHQTGAVHHLHEDASVVEVIDEAGRPVPPGTPGELVVTPLTTSGMALFRYRLGDRGQLLTGACGCGSAARSVLLLGRMPNSMTVDTITFSSDHLMAALGTLGVSGRRLPISGPVGGPPLPGAPAPVAGHPGRDHD